MAAIFDYKRLCARFSSTNDPYIALGLERNCTFSEAKQAYRKCALEVHPDKASVPPKDKAELQQRNELTVLLNLAYESIEHAIQTGVPITTNPEVHSRAKHSGKTAGDRAGAAYTGLFSRKAATNLYAENNLAGFGSLHERNCRNKQKLCVSRKEATDIKQAECLQKLLRQQCKAVKDQRLNAARLAGEAENVEKVIRKVKKDIKKAERKVIDEYAELQKEDEDYEVRRPEGSGRRLCELKRQLKDYEVKLRAATDNYEKDDRKAVRTARQLKRNLSVDCGHSNDLSEPRGAIGRSEMVIFSGMAGDSSPARRLTDECRVMEQLTGASSSISLQVQGPGRRRQVDVLKECQIQDRSGCLNALIPEHHDEMDGIIIGGTENGNATSEFKAQWARKAAEKLHKQQMREEAEDCAQAVIFAKRQEKLAKKIVRAKRTMHKRAASRDPASLLKQTGSWKSAASTAGRALCGSSSVKRKQQGEFDGPMSAKSSYCDDRDVDSSPDGTSPSQLVYLTR